MKRVMMTALAVAALATPAMAKDAWCYSSDDGEYACEFQPLDGNGSFEISASGKPTFQLWIDSPGVATVGATFEAGGRSVALPGTYYRSNEDPACWVSDATDTEICAW
ncbi:hypothetical protein [Devosia sp. SL43]|uniref:hypothetical protein n=1 Tax=Devosia sp. SL43 TaxID=2806348 RepID=UPI001F261310|nr:hypothetical protein [Devosia sp. SL43]